MSGRIPQVVVIGPAYVDMAIKCPEFPQPGRIVDGSGFSCIPTGSGLNQATQASLCGCEVHLIAKVGSDPFGEMLKDNLRRYKVDIDFVYTAPAISTGIIVTMVTPKGVNRSCLSAGANRSIGEDEIACAPAEQVLSDADVCLIDGSVPYEAIQSAMKICQVHKTKIIVQTEVSNFESGDEVIKHWPVDYMSADVIIPYMAGCGGVETTAGAVHKFKMFGAELVAKGIGCVVMNIGSRGGIIVDREGSLHVEGFSLDIVDYNGYEDAFAGAFTASFAVGDTAARATKFACAASALALSRFGGQDALPEKEQILELLL